MSRVDFEALKQISAEIKAIRNRSEQDGRQSDSGSELTLTRGSLMTSSLSFGKIAALTTIILLFVASAGQAQLVKEGDVIALKAGRGYLSWYSGNWVVINNTSTAEPAQQWTVTGLSESGGKTYFQLKNGKYGQLDGDNDNSVVLDDSDHSNWYTSSKFQIGANIKIANRDWSGEYYLKDRGDTGSSWDVVLRKTDGTSFKVTRVSDDRNPQYGFAHRVNDPGVLKAALDAGVGGGNVAGNGIEFDITYEPGNSTWEVYHSGDLKPAGYNRYATVEEWLDVLKGHLATGKYNVSFAALWLDIKTPNDDDVTKLVKYVRARIPDSVSVIYDLGAVANYNSGSGYQKMKSFGLNANEGLGMWVKNSGEAQKFYDICKRDSLTRTVVHHGHALNISESLLEEINKADYHKKSDACRFSKVFTWTNDLTSSIAACVNPKNKYHTDGQIVGAPTRQWYASFDDLQDFDNAVSQFSDTQRKAVRTDDFWGRSGSDQ